MYSGRAKTIMGAEVIEGGRCREIAAGSFKANRIFPLVFYVCIENYFYSC
jgi:hypothetical protein